MKLILLLFRVSCLRGLFADASQVSSSVDCKVFVEGDQLAFRGSDGTFVGADGQTVTVQATNSSLTANETCSSIQTHTGLL